MLLVALTSCATSKRSRPAVKSSAELQQLVEQLSQRVASQSERISDLERVTPKEFEIVHYNLLADHASSNLNPWFLYGADVTPTERKELTRRFYAGDKRGYKDVPNKGWPDWAVEVLSPERRALLEEYDRNFFAWERRRERLWGALREVQVGCRRRSPDLLTLAECDHYDDYWEGTLRSGGYDSVWRRRPRAGCTDGSVIAWRASTFSLVAEGGFDFGNSLETMDTKKDRTCLFTLLRWRRDPSARLLVATTHLARDPESAKQQYARGFQYGVIFRELLAFANANDAEDVPVVLTGDLNAKDCDELAGIARALVRLTSAPTHPLIWSILDAPTPATTVTEERALRIDYILYQSTALQLRGVGQLPRMLSPIPDAEHPSDHLPVSARLLVRPSWNQVEDDARQWLACISGTTSVRPISGKALRAAFTYFDKSGSGYVSLVQLEAGLQTLGFPGLSSAQIQQALIDAGCDVNEPDEMYHALHGWRAPSETAEAPWVMDLSQFVQVYMHSVQRCSSTMARQLDMAFAAFDSDSDGVLEVVEMRDALRRMASAPLDDTQVDNVLAELDSNGDGKITLTTFSDWMTRTYVKRAEGLAVLGKRIQ